MKHAVKASVFNHCRSIRVALFHSTAVLERKSSHSWDSFRNNNSSYSKRRIKMHAKEETLRNINADNVFQGERKDYSREDDPFSSRDFSWFKRDYSKGPRRNRTGDQGPRHWGKSYGFCKDDDEGDIDVETIFRSAFGGNRFFYWSFVNEDYSQRGRSSNRGKSWRKKFEYTEDDDSSTDSEVSHSDLASNRRVLGLSAYGPLKLEDVKSAYRACALKWHPDRHQGSSKVSAEEKFKHCSAAYESLCDKLDVD